MTTTRGRLSLALGLGLLAWPLCKLADASSWPYFRKDEAKTGYSQEEAAPPLSLRWTFDAGAAIYSSPVVAYGRVYVGARDKKLYCLDAFTGALLWSFTAEDWIDATPAVADGRVFVASRDGNLYAFDALTGALQWSYKTSSRDVASAVFYAGEVYAATGNPKRLLYVLDARTGAFHRSVTLSQFTASSPVLDKNAGLVYLGTNDGRYGAWNTTLTPKWPAPVQTKGNISFATPSLSGGKLLAAPGDDDYTLHAYNPASGAQVWASPALSLASAQVTSVAVSTDTVYVGAGQSPYTLYALSLSAGSIKWSLPLGDANVNGLASSPAVANDIIYVVSPLGELLAVSAAGSELARINLGMGGPGVSSPAVANGWVYAAAQGRVFGFQASRAWAISGPDPIFDVPTGVVTVTGTVVTPQLSSYRVDFGSGTSPAQWTVLAVGTQTVTEGALATWDTSNLADGDYTLRLSVQETAASGLATESRSVFNLAQIMTASVDPTTLTTLSLPDGTEVEIPAGALTGADTLSAKRVSSGLPPAIAPADVSATGIVREFKLASDPHPKFAKPVTLKIPYGAYQPKVENNLRMYYFDDSAGAWKIVNTSVVNKAEKRVWAKTDHFTLFQVFEFKPNGTLLVDAQVYVYPNPARGETATFKFMLGDTCDVTVRVFDVTGALVAEMTKLGNPAGLVSTIDWNIGGKASGVYIYRVEAKTSAGKTESVIKKMAIIH